MNYIKLFQEPDSLIQKSKLHFTKLQNDDLIYYYNELKKQNLSDNLIIAILANAVQESSLNHSSINKSTGAKGLLLLKDQDLLSYNKYISENNMEDTGLSLILFYLYRINNDIDHRRDTYKRSLELSQSKNKVDRDNGLKGLKLFEGMENKWFTEDFVRLFWNNDKASLNDLIKGWMDYIERPSKEEKNESINKRYNYGLYIKDYINKYNLFMDLNVNIYKKISENNYDVYKYYNGGKAANHALDFGKRLIPIYGTYLDWQDFSKNKTVKNALLATASTVGDALTLFGVGSGIKGWVAATKAADKVSDAYKVYKTAHKTASNANDIYKKANTAFDKALNKVTSITLAGGNLSQIVAAQLKANTARLTAQEAAGNYKNALLALDGTVPTLKSTTKVTPGGAAFKQTIIDKYYPQNWLYIPNADINLKRAQANYDLASDYLKQAKQASVVLPLGGIAIKGSVLPMKDILVKKDGGIINYLNLFK